MTAAVGEAVGRAVVGVVAAVVTVAVGEAVGEAVGGAVVGVVVAVVTVAVGKAVGEAVGRTVVMGVGGLLQGQSEWVHLKPAKKNLEPSEHLHCVYRVGDPPEQRLVLTPPDWTVHAFWQRVLKSLQSPTEGSLVGVGVGERVLVSGVGVGLGVVAPPEVQRMPPELALTQSLPQLHTPAVGVWEKGSSPSGHCVAAGTPQP